MHQCGRLRFANRPYALGKGNKLISIPSARVKAREEFVVMAAVIPQGQSVTLFSGKRKLTLKPSDLDYYRGERGRRGAKLPRGLQRVDRIEIETVAGETVAGENQEG
ncbi:UNVERIFIED_CONTAM: hypothetical protein K2H54_000278 [Gekko kuhli]